MNVRQRNKGTASDPTLIPSLYDKRLVGCVCKYNLLLSVLVVHVCVIHFKRILNQFQYKKS